MQTCLTAAVCAAVGVLLAPVTMARADDWSVAEVAPALQTPPVNEADLDADADDPAFWLSPDGQKALVIGAVKNGGIRVYGMDGALVQTIAPHEDGRINNVDVVHGVTLADGSTADLVIGADRGLDIVRVWRIDGASDAPLTEITDPATERAFPTRPVEGGGTEDNPVDDQATVYGLTSWRDPASGTVWIAGTQRHQPVVGLFRLEAGPDGVRAVKDHEFAAPTEHMGQSLWEESEDDVLKDFSPQFEGLVIDRTTGELYAGQEDVGIWRVPVTGGTPELLYQTRGAEGSPFFNPDSRISRDVEGLSIYYGDGIRYLIASSQGAAHGEPPVHAEAPYDDSFAVFAVGPKLDLLGSFRVAAKGDIDAVQESDGDDVISTAMPGFPNGLFVTQDGYAGDLNNLDDEVEQTNFKFVDWAEIAKGFDPPLQVAPQAYDPRK